MDPFSITVGALGITEFAISSIVSLRKLIDDLAEAKQVVHDIASDLEAVQRPLNALQALRISDQETYDIAKDDLEKTGVAEAVNSCGKSCAEFSRKLKQWTKHSSDARLSLRDHLSVGVWNKQKLQKFQTQVRSCQANVQLAVQGSQL